MRDRYQPGQYSPDSVGSFLRHNWLMLSATGSLVGCLGLGGAGTAVLNALDERGLRLGMDHGNNWASLQVESVDCSVVPSRGIEEREIVGMVLINGLPTRPDIYLLDLRANPIRKNC